MKEKNRTKQYKILVVEDDAPLQALLREELSDAGYIVKAVSDAEAAWASINKKPVDLIVSDLRLPASSGLDLLLQTRQLALPPGFIMITAFGTVEQAVEALKKGADDFLTKPLKLDHLRICVDRAIKTRQLQEEVSRYRQLIGANGFHGMIGQSDASHRLFETVRMVAHAEGPVLIQGESGTGKELVARAVHAESLRKEGPFIAVNCAGIPPELLESELFGHTASAFTGAQRTRKGLFAEADGGSLLLDEIGEMPMEMQAKLLRILQDGQVRPVGSDREKQLDVRIIAATNKDLYEEVSAGQFREDLYFRLETFSVYVPALRERGEDIELLTAHFINYFNIRLQKDVQGISAPALERIKAYHFPGNIRELSSAMERAVTFCKKREIEIADLPERFRLKNGPNSIQQQGLLDVFLQDGELPTLQEFELQYIDFVLNQLKGNKRRAAEILAIGRRTLYRRLQERFAYEDDRS